MDDKTIKKFGFTNSELKAWGTVKGWYLKNILPEVSEKIKNIILDKNKK